MRARIPVFVDEHARGNKPTGVVPSRNAASVEREQQMLKHCLQKKSREKKQKEISSFFIQLNFNFYSQACKFIKQRSSLI